MSQLSNAMHQHKLACWKQIIIDCRTSGLTANEYMRRHKIKKAAFYYWLRKIREELLEEHPEYLHQPKPSREAASAETLSAPVSSADASVTVGAGVVPAAPAAFPVRAGGTSIPPAPLPEFVSVRASAPLPRDKLLVSCGPFQFELAEDTPVSLLQKLAAAREGPP